MAKAKKGGISLFGFIIILVLIKNLVPILAGIVSFAIKLSILALIVLVVAVIIKGFKGDKQAAPGRQTVDVKTHGVNSGAGSVRPLTPEERQKLQTANSQLVQLKAMAARVKDTEIRNLFVAATDVIGDILKELKSDPDDIQPAHRVLSYYIPSLKAIMDKYARLEVSGTDMGDTPEKLKQHLREITAALSKQRDNLYGSDKLDLTVEMKAMSMALKRDGLVDDGLEGQQLAKELEKVIDDFKLDEAQPVTVEG